MFDDRIVCCLLPAQPNSMLQTCFWLVVVQFSFLETVVRSRKKNIQEKCQSECYHCISMSHHAKKLCFGFQLFHSLLCMNFMHTKNAINIKNSKLKREWKRSQNDTTVSQETETNTSSIHVTTWTWFGDSSLWKIIFFCAAWELKT